MKRFLTWAAGAAGGLAAYRAAARRRPAPVEPVAGDSDPAGELRAKLAEVRAAEAEKPDDPDARRTGVHEQGRAAIDEMRGSDGA